MIRKMKKLLFAVAIIGIFNSFIAFGSREGLGSIGGGDVEKEQMWVYTYEDGTRALKEWKQINNNWYFFGEDGKSKQNTWAEIDGKWYYFDQWSVMLHDTTTPDGHYVGSDGAWVPEASPATNN